MRNRRAPVALLAAVCVGFLARDASAQDNTIARLYKITPTQGMGAEFEAALKQHAEWRAAQNDPWSWDVYQVVNGEDLGTFYIRSGSHGWADLDAYDAGFGPMGEVNFTATVGPAMESISVALTSVDTTNLRWPEDQSSVNLLQIYTYHLKPTHEQAFNGAVAKFHGAIVQADFSAHYAFETLVNGAKGPMVNLILPYPNWAAFQEPEKTMEQMLAELWGEEELMAVGEQFSSSFTTVESMVLRLRRDLSVIGAPEM